MAQSPLLDALDIVPKSRSPGAVYNPKYDLISKAGRQSSLKGRTLFGSIEAQATTGRDVPGPGHYDMASIDSAHAALSTSTSRQASLSSRSLFDGSLTAARGKDVPGEPHFWRGYFAGSTDSESSTALESH